MGNRPPDANAGSAAVVKPRQREFLSRAGLSTTLRMQESPIDSCGRLRRAAVTSVPVRRPFCQVPRRCQDFAAAEPCRASQPQLRVPAAWSPSQLNLCHLEPRPQAREFHPDALRCGCG
eukprot:CAMPEP_0172836898 /NCGR_PEP_ID=MMETSP1075-20121228/26801_1 /TAXON_ID=2916 /ORGANISM="Ceratium fusus, Strain PA161109" /LENGTH=118 /DNA_ID=CAMNT_0013680205 /DNA_START=271 /DNA_END=628 /DNA_ORIENTATION=+